jgi:hypothetical protein
MTEGAIPVAADDCLTRFDDAMMGGFHTISPTSSGPHRLRSGAPFSEGNVGRGAVVLDAPTRNPTVREYIAPGLKIINHCGNQRPYIRRLRKRIFGAFWAQYELP